MTDNLKQFLLAVASDKEWVEWVNALVGRQEAIKAAIKKAAELGLDLTPADFEKPGGELSEEELADIAGGACNCVLSGSGIGSLEPILPSIFDDIVIPTDGPTTITPPITPPTFIPAGTTE